MDNNIYHNYLYSNSVHNKYIIIMSFDAISKIDRVMELIKTFKNEKYN